MKKSIFVSLLLVATMGAQAEDKFEMKLRAKGGPNFLQESEQLHLSAEPSVQEIDKPTTRSYSLGYSRLQAGFLKVKTPSHVVRYDLGEHQDTLQFGFAAFPWRKAGQWGVQFTSGYGFLEQKVGGRTTLHVIPSSLEAIYRARSAKRSLIAPQASVGIGNVIYVQRGLSQFNTSESQWLGVARVGLWWGVGEWLDPRSPVPTEVTLTYSRLFAKRDQQSDWNGSVIGLNVGVGL